MTQAQTQTRNIDISEWSNEMLKCIGVALLNKHKELTVLIKLAEAVITLGNEPPPNVVESLKKIKDAVAEMSMLLDVLNEEARVRLFGKKENTDA